MQGGRGGRGLGRARDPLWAARGALPGAQSRPGARGSGAEPDAEPDAEGSPARGGAPGRARQSGGGAEPGSTSTKRKGNQPALTCKQALPSGAARADGLQARSLAPRPACNPAACPPRALPAGPRAAGGCSSRPRLAVGLGQEEAGRPASAQRRGQGAQPARRERRPGGLRPPAWIRPRGPRC